MTTSISSANSSYMNSIIANAQKNINTEKELKAAAMPKAPAPVTSNIASSNSDTGFYKTATLVAVGGTLFLQAMNLLKKPQNIPNEEKMREIAKEIVAPLIENANRNSDALSQSSGNIMQAVGRLQEGQEVIKDAMQKHTDDIKEHVQAKADGLGEQITNGTQQVVSKISEAEEKAKESNRLLAQILGNMYAIFTKFNQNQEQMSSKIDEMPFTNISAELATILAEVRTGKVETNALFTKMKEFLTKDFITSLETMAADSKDKTCQTLIKTIKETASASLGTITETINGSAKSTQKAIQDSNGSIIKAVGDATQNASKAIRADISKSASEINGKIQQTNDATVAFLKEQFKILGIKVEDISKISKGIKEGKIDNSNLLAEIAKITGKNGDAYDLILSKLGVIVESNGKIGANIADVAKKADDLSVKLTNSVEMQRMSQKEIKDTITKAIAASLGKVSDKVDNIKIPEFDAELVSKLIATQVFDGAAALKIQSDYAKLLEMLSGNATKEDAAKIHAKFTQLLDEVKLMNEKGTQADLDCVLRKVEEAVAGSSKSGSPSAQKILDTFFTPIKSIKFKKGQACLERNGKPFTGTVIAKISSGNGAPKEDTSLITYINGKIDRSFIFDKNGKEKCRKIYTSGTSIDEAGNTVVKSNVKKHVTSQNTPKEYLYSDKRTYDKDGFFLGREFGLHTMDSKQKTANQYLHYMQDKSSTTILEDSPRTRRWYLKDVNGKSYNLSPEELPRETVVKNGIKTVNLTTRAPENS